jgi:N utilization substance protein B
MGKRRQAREFAVQFLFQGDFNPDCHKSDMDEALRVFWEDKEATDDVRQFATELIQGAVAHQAGADELIRKYADNWDINRIAAVDRNVMRLAIYEMLHRSDVPPVVSINEAVDIAKKFSTHESGKFVNGILDRIRKDIPRDARTAQGSAST